MFYSWRKYRKETPYPGTQGRKAAGPGLGHTHTLWHFPPTQVSWHFFHRDPTELQPLSEPKDGSGCLLWVITAWTLPFSQQVFHHSFISSSFVFSPSQLYFWFLSLFCSNVHLSSIGNFAMDYVFHHSQVRGLFLGVRKVRKVRKVVWHSKWLQPPRVCPDNTPADGVRDPWWPRGVTGGLVVWPMWQTMNSAN